MRKNDEIDFDMDKLETPSRRQKLINDMREAGMAHLGIANYLLETMFE